MFGDKLLKSREMTIYPPALFQVHPERLKRITFATSETNNSHQGSSLVAVVLCIDELLKFFQLDVCRLYWSDQYNG
jgi:hypothetical protein